jgi:hypothetical protein
VRRVFRVVADNDPQLIVVVGACPFWSAPENPDTKDLPLTANLTAKITLDMSAAPEIARLAEAAGAARATGATEAAGATRAADAPVPAQPSADPASAAPRLTLGALAARLRDIAAAPEQWWALVRFDPDRPVRITIDRDPSCTVWLTIQPPGNQGNPGNPGTPGNPGNLGQPCDCDAATIIAGEATEGPENSAPLRPGPIRVHGRPHVLRGHGPGYTVIMHAQATRGYLKTPVIGRN